MAMTYYDLIARWNTDEGKPYKGSLIDWHAYTDEPNNPGCMCAQGQVLHDLGGWMPQQLHEVDQAEADSATATLLNISRAHGVLLRQVNDSVDGAPGIVLTNPGKILGDQWSKVLDFWWHLDGITKDQWAAARDAGLDATMDAVRYAAVTAARDSARDAARYATTTATRYAAGVDAVDAAVDAGWATNEIQGAESLKRDGEPFFFLPMFGFASPDDIPPRPENYGVPS